MADAHIDVVCLCLLSMVVLCHCSHPRFGLVQHILLYDLFRVCIPASREGHA